MGRTLVSEREGEDSNVQCARAPVFVPTVAAAAGRLGGVLVTGRVILALVLAGQLACSHAFDPVASDDSADASGFAGASQATRDCVDTRANGVAYRVCASLENYAEAAAACAAWGGTLVILDSEQEELGLTEFAYQHGTANFWIGATDLDAESVWTWADGRVFWDHGQIPKAAYSHWIVGEPANDGSMSTAGEDCAYMFRKVGWNDVDCSFERAYACEGR